MTDIIETSIPTDIRNKTDIFLSKLYTYIKDNRNELGYPSGTNVSPYLYMTNDLCNKYFQMNQLCIKNNIQFDVPTFLDIHKALIESYDDHTHNTGKLNCCSFYYSKTKEQMLELYNKLIENK
jgi:hypothetical protein